MAGRGAAGILGAAFALCLASPAVSAACRDVAVTTPSGPLAGIEDMVVLPDGETLLLSAYDRTAVEAALAEEGVPPTGGLYTVPLAALHGSDAPLAATPLTDGLAASLDFRPHGIDAIATSGGVLVAAVDRRYPLREGVRVRDTALSLFLLEGDTVRHLTTIEDPAFCRANDVALADGITAFVTADQAACDGPALWAERLMGEAGGRVLRVTWDPEVSVVPVAHGLSFANGIVADAVRDALWVAETQAGEIRRMALSPLLGADPAAGEVARAVVSGAPDNLTLAADGGVTAAVQSAPLRFFLSINGWGALPPAHAVAVSAEGEAVPVDGASALGATVALRDGSITILGSGWSSGLTVCGAED